MALKKSEENKEKATAKKAPVKKAPSKKVAAGKVAAKKTETKKTAPKKVVKKLPGEIEVIVDAILEKKGQNVISLDLRKEGSGICDFFVICNADSTTNVSAIADNIEDQMIARLNKKVLRSQGKENRFWIIQDYGDIVVHVFQTEYRNFYRLEDLWSDCEKKTYED